MFSKFGEKIGDFLGDRTYGTTLSYFEEIYQQITQFYKISNLFPYESYNDKFQLFFNKGSLGFVLETPALVGASEEMQKELSSLFQNVLPPDSSLQIMLFADPHIGSILDSWMNARVSPIMQDLAKKRIDHLNKFAFKSPNYPYSLRNFRCIISFSQKEVSTNEVILTEVNQIKNQIVTTLEMLGLGVVIWDPTILINTLSSIVNIDPDLTKFHLKRYDPLELISEQIADLGNNLLVRNNDLSLNLGKIKVRSYQATQIPTVWSLHAMGQLIGDEDRDQAQIPCPFILHYGVHIPKQSKLKAQVLTKATYVERQANSPIGKYLPAILKEAEELSFAREQLGRGERIVQTSLSVILFGEPNTLSSCEQILLNLYLSKEWQLRPNKLFHLPMFLSCLPMYWGDQQIKTLLHYKKLKTTLSTEAANLLPIQAEWCGSKTPGILLGGRRGQIMTWSPFDNQAGNYNVCVVGRPGSGKSVFMQELMVTTLGLGGRVFVLDVGRSFEKTCLLLGGRFIEFKTKTPICLNPFSSIPVDENEATQDALSMLKSILILMAAPTKGLDDLEAAILEKAMLEVWRQTKQDSNITDIADYLSNQPDSKAKDLGKMLFPFTTQGVYGRFFNGASTVNLNDPLVVVELEELKERKDLQSVVVQMIIINITNRMFLGDRKTPFTIVFDEAWDLLRGVQGGLFIETLARRLRKYNGSLVIGTQSVNDLFVNNAAQAAFDNSDWMCLLSQKSESIEQLKKLGRVSLTPMMESQLKSVKTKQGEYAEVMIYGSSGFAIARLLLDPYSHLLYSSKAQDYTKVQTLRAQGLGLGEALDVLLKESQ